MKKYIYIGILILFSGCSLLDIDEHIGYEKENIWEYRQRVTASLSNLYTYLPDDFTSVGSVPRSCATDDAIYVRDNSPIRNMTNGTWSALNDVDGYWDKGYEAIRATNLFLEGYDEGLLEKYKYEDPVEYENMKKYFLNYPYEARFLRAFYHFELAKRYGDIPIIKKTYTADSINSVKKSSFEQVVAFIVEECDTVAKYLPKNYANLSPAETGRATLGAVMALKSRVLLYFASDLHNPGQIKQRWIDAAQAAADVMNLNTYTLTPGNYGFNAFVSGELIFEKRFAKSNSFEAANFPVGVEGGKTGMCPTQNLVDAFGMANGTEFDWSNPAHAKDPYLKRDPRLAQFIVVNESKLGSENIEIFEGGRNGLPISYATPTGYYLRKYLQPAIKLTPANPTTADHVWTIFRFAEILLNYAEAMNEAFDSPTYTDANFKRSAKWALDVLRGRYSIPKNSPSDPTSFEVMVRNERRVELCFEDHRFWDIRRWKIGEQTTRILGTKIERIENVSVYTPNKLVEDRIWNDKMYLYPIPYLEVMKNPNLTQNKGW